MELHALNDGCGQFTRRIGSTTYLVTVRFSGKGKETFEDKILRLIEKEARKTA
ncbi:transposon-encoded TnpW family protein [Ruthenibacterium lactatiformans]|nr:transposon-encoded TnpW family protein [Ruthenibacterium lactatiformans]